MFNDSKIQISDETNYLKVFQHTDVGMVTLRLDLENQVLKRKLRHALGISIPSVRQIEATTDALLGWMSPDELLYFCMKSEAKDRKAERIAQTKRYQLGILAHAGYQVK